MTYRDRRDAGAVLAGRLARYAARTDVTVLGLVRGGVPVAAEIARGLAAPLAALVVRKLGVPWAPEVAFGAIGPGGVQVINKRIVRSLPASAVERVVRHESAELARRERRYHPGGTGLHLAGRVAVVVDDGLATGATASAAVAVCRRLDAARVVVAVPVGSWEAVTRTDRLADEVVCPLVPVSFGAVGHHYVDFRQLTDDEVARIVDR